MTSPKVSALVADDIDDLPERCRHCLFWELGLPRPDSEPAAGGDADQLAGDPTLQKQAWCSARTMEGSRPGATVRIGGRIVGFALFAPSESFARGGAAVPRASPDALLLATAWVEPDQRGRGVGRLLVQQALREALRADLAAVEAYGDRRFRQAACVLPCTWLLHEGFEVHREHPRYPLLRVDTKRTVRWAESLENALDEVLGRIPQRAPQTRPRGPEPA